MSSNRADDRGASDAEDFAGGNPKNGGSDHSQRITHSLVERVGEIAEACGARSIFVYEDALKGDKLPLPENSKLNVFYVCRRAEEGTSSKPQDMHRLHVPRMPLTRLGQVKIAVFLALSRGLLREGDILVFLSGLAGSGNLDTLIVTEVGREFEIISTSEEYTDLPSDILPAVLDRVIDLAAELGSEGREGKPLGTIFVVGDAEKVRALTRQLILNPFRGYSEQERNILDPALTETVKELSSIDGAFIIRGDGVIETCGALLKVSTQDDFALPPGLGARHHAAAGITDVTDSLAVAISASTGTVTVFRRGKIVVDIEKPHSLA
jgi:DNA integrity scanning protein DisA with diadenylate cyclase activity